MQLKALASGVLVANPSTPVSPYARLKMLVGLYAPHLDEHADKIEAAISPQSHTPLKTYNEPLLEAAKARSTGSLFPAIISLCL